ncbi:IPT/TIG domain-containing protein [bacterium]|nr:IPT/TIG domain-containing protein [bacterium]
MHLMRLPFVLALALMLAACRLPSSSVAPMPSGPEKTQVEAEAVRELTGKVAFPRALRPQATLEEVAAGATVSLISTGTNQTIATTVTDSAGRFILTFRSAFKPDPGTVYYLEASKGLRDNSPSLPLVRVRTLAKYVNGKWATMTRDEILLDETTTALSIGSALRNGNPAPFDFASLIGAVQIGSPSVYVPVPGLSASDCDAIRTIVNQALVADRDPMASVVLDNGVNAWVAANQGQPDLMVTVFTPGTGGVGTPVTVKGTGFRTTASNNVVRFNGTPATVTSATITSLSTAVPPGATSGPTSVQVGNAIYLGPLFSVDVVLSSFAPTSGSAGTVVTIDGSGFDPSALANNRVFFGSIPATVTAATATRLTTVVPSNATSGAITVVVSGNAKQSATSFTVPVVISSFVPTAGTPGTQVTISGSGFGTVAGAISVKINNQAVTLLAAAPNSLTVQLGSAMTTGTGPVAVTANGQSATSAASFGVFNGIASSALIQTIAGRNAPTDGTLATLWSLRTPSHVACDAAGNVYLSIRNAVYRVSPGGAFTRMAGGEYPGYSGDGGPATSARLNSPHGVALDASGNLYIADRLNHRIRKVSAGTITTVAGNGNWGFSGDNGSPLSAKLDSPEGVVLDASGTLYIADSSNFRVRKVSGGLITTVAGNGASAYSGEGVATSVAISPPRYIALDASGNLYIADTDNHRVRKVDTSGTISTVAGDGNRGFSGDSGSATSARLDSPRGLAFDASGNLYITDYYNGRIRKVSGGVITTVVGNGGAAFGGDGGAATSATLRYPKAIAFDPTGNLYIADNENHRIRKVSGGIISTFAGNGALISGDGAAASDAQFGAPAGLALDASGNLYMADSSQHCIRKITAAGVITTIAGDGNAGFSGDAGPATSARLNNPHALVLNGATALYVADSDNHRVRKIDLASGIITTVAGGGATLGDGGAATAAQLSGPVGLAIDSSGNLYVSEPGAARVRKITSGNVITTFAGGGATLGDGGPATSANLYQPHGLAVTPSGELLIADMWNHRIRKVSGGIISTIAGAGGGGDGGPATTAGLYYPSSIALDSYGTLYIAEGYKIRRVDTLNVITTLAGGAAFVDNVSAIGSSVEWTTQILVNQAGNGLYLLDANNSRIRRIQ